MPRRKVEHIANDGSQCDSKFEAMVVNDLLARGVSFRFHPDPIPYHRPVRGGFCRECDSNDVRKGALYSPDLFLIGSGRYVELKGGSWEPESRSRLLHLIQSGQQISFLFRTDRPLTRGSKTKYSEWCRRQNQPVAVGETIPEEWI